MLNLAVHLEPLQFLFNILCRFMTAVINGLCRCHVTHLWVKNYKKYIYMYMFVDNLLIHHKGLGSFINIYVRLWMLLKGLCGCHVALWTLPLSKVLPKLLTFLETAWTTWNNVLNPCCSLLNIYVGLCQLL